VGIDEDRLGKAQALYRAARLAESEALFQQLLSSPSVGVAATAGVAMIKLRNGDDASARKLFESVLLSQAHPTLQPRTRTTAWGYSSQAELDRGGRDPVPTSRRY